MSEPPQLRPFPVSTPVNSFASRLYWPKRYPISRPPTPMSPAGTSVLGPMCRNSSVMNDWQNRMTSLSDLPWIEVRTALTAAHRETRKRILKHLFEREKLDDARVNGRMKT